MSVWFQDAWLTIRHGDVRAELADMEADSVHCVVTSPPYWGLRDYGQTGQLGLEATPEEYVENMVDVFRSVRRVLRPDGLLWLNLGDTYADRANRRSDGESFRSDRADVVPGKRNSLGGGFALKAKDLVGIPWRVALALQADGWWLRSDVIWHKPNPQPESVGDRPARAHEYVFMLAKSSRYFYDAEAIREPATSSESDLRKMAEQRDRIGGKHLLSDDPLMAASAASNLGRKRSVGGRPLSVPAGWNNGPTEIDKVGRYSDGRWPRGWASGEGRGHDPQVGRYEPPDGREYVPQAGRSKRTVWTIPTQPYPGAHFATFPRRLVEPPILASTSDRGVCPGCGAPWRREVASEPIGRIDNGSIDETIGWRPGCDHGLDLVPATVLDPFAGTGTTMAVAQQLSRRAIGIDISMEYLEQLARRNRALPLGI